MFRHSTNSASLFSVLIAALIFSLSLVAIAAAQDNTSLGTGALQSNITGQYNTATGLNALFFNTTGSYNTAIGFLANVSAISASVMDTRWTHSGIIFDQAKIAGASLPTQRFALRQNPRRS
jgi:hypothetical protein